MKAGWGRGAPLGAQVRPEAVARLVVETVLGDFLVEASDRGLRAVTPLRAGSHASAEGGDEAAGRHAIAAAQSLRQYAAGGRSPYVGPLDTRVSELHRLVWGHLRAIPFGATTTYGGIAAALGMPGEARAVGAAVAANPVCILVPCHRVVASDGSLRGFAWGLDLKRRLLAHEGSASGSLFAGASA